MGDIADMMCDNMIEQAVDSYCGEKYYGRQRTVWKMKNGKGVNISDMDTAHLVNTIKMLTRQIDGSAHDDLCWDYINAMRDELKRRNSKVDKLQNVDLKVVGVTFKNEDGSSRKDKIVEISGGDTTKVAITMEREPNNQYDPNAVMVKADGFQIGYIGKDYAAILAEMIDNGRQFTAVVKGVGVYNNRPFCEITVNEI